MAHDEDLANRIRELFSAEDGHSEMAMFGGLAFMLEGNMALAISSSGELMVRVGAEHTDEALSHPHSRPCIMGSREMKGWILVEREGLKTKRQLGPWVSRGSKFARTLPPKR
jgi:TfoX N-terminal domain